MIKITLKDGSVREAAKGLSILDVAKSISEGLARNAQCGKVNGEVKDLRTILNEDCTLEICTFDSKEGKDAVRHSVSHVLAAAVKRLFPEAKIAIGPSIENGFYYDIDLDHRLTNEDLEQVIKLISNIQVVYFNCGHGIHNEKPREFIKSVENTLK